MKAMSLFSGVGGFEQGFDRAGIETVIQVEIDARCRTVLERHWPQTERIADVRKVQQAKNDSSEIGPHSKQRVGVSDGDGTHYRHSIARSDIQLVFGGFPCQPFSVAGRREGDRDDRNLWPEFRRVVQELQPRWVVAENVPGLLSFDQGRFFASILDDLGDIGFEGVAYTVLDSQHFGVPQRRRRVFIVAGPSRQSVEQVLSICESCTGDSPQSSPTSKNTSCSPGSSSPESGGECGDGVRDETESLEVWYGYGKGQGSDSYDGTSTIARSVLTSSNNDSGTSTTLISKHVPDASVSKTFNKTHRAPKDTGDIWKEHDIVPTLSEFDLGNDHRSVTLISDDIEENQDRLAQTVNSRDYKGAGSFRDGGIQGHAVIENHIRRLTPIECERLMGWPDDWTRWNARGEEISMIQRYKMIGNGVVAPVAEWIGRRIVKVDEGLK